MSATTKKFSKNTSSTEEKRQQLIDMLRCVYRGEPLPGFLYPPVREEMEAGGILHFWLNGAPVFAQVERKRG